MFRKKQSAGIRVWHWLNALVIFLLFGTVYLRNTFFSVKKNQVLLMEKANTLGVMLSENQARDLAREVRNQMWQWHPIIGFVAIGLLVFRIVLCFVDKNEVKQTASTYYKLVKKSYLLFYILLGVMGVTGVLMYWDETFHLSEGFNHQIKEIHENLLWFFVAFVVIHILGVIRAEMGEDKGLISDMVNGGEDK